jgi:Flp pilus assembly protein TadG
MNIKKTVVVALSMAVLSAVPASTARADEWNKLTYVTFSKDVAIPGRVLTAGTYIFRLMDSQSNRHIVQIFNQTGTQLITTLLTIGDYRLSPTDDTVITFGESAGNAPPPVTRWFYPGDTDGDEFIYPNSSHATPATP